MKKRVIKSKLIRLKNDNIFDESIVSVTLHKDNKALYRISVWGLDDFGIEKEFNDMCTAIDYYTSIEDFPNIDQLYLDGFKRA